MDLPPSSHLSGSGSPSRRTEAQEQQLRSWLLLRDEMAELHARLEYLKLMLSLRVAR